MPIGTKAGEGRIRKSSLFGPLGVGMLILVASCSPNSGNSDATTIEVTQPTLETSTTNTRAESTQQTFPTAIEHRFGITEIPKRPERVIALMDDEFVLAAGVTPIAMSRNPNTESGLSQFIEGAVGDAEIQLLDVSGGIPYEQVTALGPDLIVGGVTDSDYAALAQIAPTLPYVTDPNIESWQDRQFTVGEALGMSGGATQVVTDLERYLSDLASSHPELNGATYSLSVIIDVGLVSTFRDPQEAGNKLLASLGLQLADGVQALDAADLSGRATVSLERLDVLAADLVMMAALSADLQTIVEESPFFDTLLGGDGGGYIPLDLITVLALARPGPYNIPIVLDSLVPRLVDARG